MHIGHYAAALATLRDLPETKREEGLRRLVSYAVKRGHKHLLPKIARAYERFVARENANRRVQVIAAKEMSHEDALSLVRAEGIETDGAQVSVIVDPTLVGGAIMRTREERIDKSDRRALLELYHRVTN